MLVYRVMGYLRRCIPVAAALLGLLGPAVMVEAREQPPRALRDLVAKSAYVVLAECTAVEVAPVDSLGGNLFTFSHFRIQTNIAGDLEPEFTLRLIGGRRGDVWIDAPLMPRFRPGERVLLVLGRKNADGFPALILGGVFRVRDDQGGGLGTIEIPAARAAGMRAEDVSSHAMQRSAVAVEDFIRLLTSPPPRVGAPNADRVDGW